MIASNAYQSTFAQDLQNLIDRGDVSSACHMAFAKSSYPAVLAMTNNDKYQLVHELISAKPIRDDMSNEMRPYVNFASYFLLSIPYEGMRNDEMAKANDMSLAIKAFARKMHVSSVSDKIIFAQKIADFYCVQHNVDDMVNIGSWVMSGTPSPQETAMFKGCKAFHARGIPTSLTAGRGIVVNNMHDSKMNLMFSVEALAVASANDVGKWVCHEMRHVEQSINMTPSVAAQKKHSVEGRVIGAFPRSAYYTLMNERQAYAFDAWVHDMIEGKAPRNPDVIMDDIIARNKLMGDDALAAVKNFRHFALQSKNGSEPVVKYFSGKKPPSLSYAC